ncbi:MAG: efflux RND transporter periplasmic adaptor subunit [Chitinophagaceae bacterium]
MKILTAVLICTLFLLSCSNKTEKTKPIVENITESVYASAIIKTKNQYQVFATVNGIINKIFVTENDLVKKGDPLMQITDKSSTINRENATLAAGYADVNTNREKLTDAKNNIALAQSKCSNDSLMYQRQKNLWNENIGTKMEVEQRELAYKNSKTMLESAKIRYNDLLKELEFNAKQAKNNLSISQYRESDFVIKSEVNGKVYSLLKVQGEMVNPQTPLAIIGDAAFFLLGMQIDEYDIAKIKLGQTVLLTMDSYKGEVFEAKVSKIIPLMNERSKSFTVEAEFVKQPPVLYPNLTAEANIIIQSKENAITIPRSYLINDSFVLVEKDKKKKVKTGLKDYQKVEIINGLTANDAIYKPQ